MLFKNRQDKLAQTFLHLLRRPNQLYNYIRYSRYLKCYNTLQLEVPWIASSATKFLENYINKNMLVFEWGSGGSSLFFANRAKFVYSIEHSKEWFNKMNGIFESKRMRNINLKYVPFDFESLNDFYDSKYLKEIQNEKYNVIFIDCFEISNIREYCFRISEKHIKKGGIIVLDDSWRYPNIRKSNNAESYHIFKSIGPARNSLTTTDIYFY